MVHKLLSFWKTGFICYLIFIWVFFFWEYVTFRRCRPGFLVVRIHLIPHPNEMYKALVKIIEHISLMLYLYMDTTHVAACLKALDLVLGLENVVWLHTILRSWTVVLEPCGGFWWAALFPGRCTGVGALWSERSGSSPTDSASPHGNCTTSYSSKLHLSVASCHLLILYECVWMGLAHSWMCLVALQRSRPQGLSSVAGRLLQQTGNQHSSCYMRPGGFQFSLNASLSVSTWGSLIFSFFPPSFSLPLLRCNPIMFCPNLLSAGLPAPQTMSIPSSSL